MSQGRYIDSNKLSVKKAKLGQHIVQSGYSTFLFSALSRKDWTKAIQKTFALHTYFSIFSGLIIFKSCLYFYDFFYSRNKNMGKVMSTLRELFSVILISVTVVGGLTASATIGAISPFLLVATMLINVSYNLGISIQNAYQFFTQKDKKIKEYYKESCKKHLIGAFFGTLVTIAMSMILIFKVAVVAMSIFSACLAGYGFATGVYTAYKEYKEGKQLNETCPDNHNMEYKENKSVSEIQRLLNFGNSSVINQKDNYYFYRKDRAKELEDANNNSQYLIQEINEKILDLKKQIFIDGNKFFSEKKKRLIKIEVLTRLKSLLLDSTKSKEDFDVLIQSSEFNTFFNNPFQSFFRQKSDTQDIFEAAEVYYAQYKITKLNVPVDRQLRSP